MKLGQLWVGEREERGKKMEGWEEWDEINGGGAWGEREGRWKRTRDGEEEEGKVVLGEGRA